MKTTYKKKQLDLTILLPKISFCGSCLRKGPANIIEYYHNNNNNINNEKIIYNKKNKQKKSYK